MFVFKTIYNNFAHCFGLLD